MRALRAGHWSVIWITRVGGGPDTDPVPAWRAVYVGGNHNVLYTLRASDGGPTWTFRGGGRITDPVPAARVVYVATFSDQLYARSA